MKTLRSLRLVVSGLLLLTGMLLSLPILQPGNQEGDFVGALICFIGGVLLIGSGPRILRNVFGVALLLLIGAVDFRAPEADAALMVASLMVLSAFLFSGSLSRVAARPLTGLIDSIYFGSNPQEVPPVTLRLARAYRRDLRFEEALQECERQLEYHPRSADLWMEMIHAAGESEDAKRMCACLRKARRRLSAEDCKLLDSEFRRYLPQSA